jgi:A/G-specific adenine glycosylase
VPYYRRFLARFPDVSTLARAELDEVLPLWAGLGYYSRARNLHAAACAVIEKHGGVFPRDLKAMMALPGIGRYTAGAVLSIAFDEKVPIVDANVARVLARVLCLEGDLKSGANQNRLWAEAENIVAASTHPSQTNPAMMELGALICVPKNPRCAVCPAQKFCCAYKTLRQNELPFVAPRRTEVELHDVCAFVLQGDRVLLRRRSDEAHQGNWWRGMWELPRVTVREGESTPDTLRRLFFEELNSPIEVAERLETMRHGVTHHKIALDCFAVQLSRFKARNDWKFFAWDEIEALALPSVMRRLLRRLRACHVAGRQLTLL